MLSLSSLKSRYFHVFTNPEASEPSPFRVICFVLFCFVLRLHYMDITKSFAIGSRFILLPLWHPPGWGMGVKVTNLWSQHWLLKQPAQPTCNKTPLWLLRNEDRLGALSQELWRKTKYLFLTRNHKPPSLSSIWFRNFLWGRLNNTHFYAQHFIPRLS